MTFNFIYHRLSKIFGPPQIQSNFGQLYYFKSVSACNFGATESRRAGQFTVEINPACFQQQINPLWNCIVLWYLSGGNISWQKEGFLEDETPQCFSGLVLPPHQESNDLSSANSDIKQYQNTRFGLALLVVSDPSWRNSQFWRKIGQIDLNAFRSWALWAT